MFRQFGVTQIERKKTFKIVRNILIWSYGERRSLKEI